MALDSCVLESTEDFFRASALFEFSSFWNIAVTAALSWDCGITGSLAMMSVTSLVAISMDFFLLNRACSALI